MTWIKTPGSAPRMPTPMKKGVQDRSNLSDCVYAKPVSNGPRPAPSEHADWLMPMATPGAPGAASLESMSAVANIMLREAATSE
eukprot:CAMPEP_0119323842 /NCGR_PEP_ID=MMETSP1333-20130426/61765_1 /TAXON_ID=418940 /ORGANISM="Scyphosphaera apsteinii, Strain RCC1455" /LENGTH=83 /DNA_ID=CAMNT_0007331401 /DNA_START=245 /DNA_END=496 /DNA_ORIENTATION=+